MDTIKEVSMLKLMISNYGYGGCNYGIIASLKNIDTKISLTIAVLLNELYGKLWKAEGFTMSSDNELAFLKIKPSTINMYPNYYEGGVDKSLVLAAVQGSGYVYRTIPQVYKTAEIYLAAIKSDPESAYPIHPDVSLTAVLRSNPKILSVISENDKQWVTQEICNMAVELDPLTLEHVPTEMRTVNLCRIAMAKDFSTHKFIPESILEQFKLLFS